MTGDFFAEVRRRHLYRIGAGYVVVAWGIIQVLDVLSQLFALPDWIAQPAVVVLAIGFPVALILAWMIVGAADQADSAQSLKATSTDWLIGGGLIAVLAFMGYQQFVPRTIMVADATVTAVADEIVQDIAERLPNSIAVLPFENLSPDPDDAYFAAGVHDEILNKLSKLRNLTVIARGSVMRYEGTDLPIPQIAQELNIEKVMTGTVRYAGDQVRVTAELIDGLTNVPVWTTEDEGDLSDIFAIQSDIAMNIANSLQAQYSVEEQNSVEIIPTDSPEAYSLYLRGRAVIPSLYGPDERNRLLAQNFFDEAIALDPEFALAHLWKANVYWASSFADEVAEADVLEHREEMYRLAKTHLDIALSIDPSLGFAHAIRARIYEEEGLEEQSTMELETALRLSPNDPRIVSIASSIASRNGFTNNEELEAAISASERAAALDPNNADIQSRLGRRLLIAGRPGQARQAFEKCLILTPAAAGCARELAQSEFALGNYQAAYNSLRSAERLSPGGGNTLAIATHGYGRLGRTEDAQRTFAALQGVDSYVSASQWSAAYMGIGDYDEAFSLLNAAVETLELPRDSWLPQGGVSEDIVFNLWSDPILEQADWVEVRESLALLP